MSRPRSRVLADAGGSEVRWCLHGSTVAFRSAVPGVAETAGGLLSEFEVAEFPDGFTPLRGEVRAYDEEFLYRRLSPTAVRVEVPGEFTEVYRDLDPAGDRFWLVDEAWGLCELDVAKGTWTSWLLPHATDDPYLAVEQAILRPMAHLLTSRGLHLIPAASVIGPNGQGVLLISPFGLGSETATLTAEGYRVVGNRWTAVRDDQQRGRRSAISRHLAYAPSSSPTTARASLLRVPGWTDAWSAADSPSPQAWGYHAWCDALVLVRPGRGTESISSRLSPSDAVTACRAAWPMPGLQETRRGLQYAGRLARTVPVWSIALDDRPQTLDVLLRHVLNVQSGISPRETPQVATAARPRRMLAAA